VVCDEHGIGGGGEYCGDNDSHLGRINALYHGALGGKYVYVPLGSELRSTQARFVVITENYGDFAFLS
jgi:hypothetical protein